VCGEVEQRVCKHVWQPDAANQLDVPSKGQGSFTQRRGLKEWQPRCVRQQRGAVGSPAQGTVVHQTQCSLPHKGAPLPPTNERSAPFPFDKGDSDRVLVWTLCTERSLVWIPPNARCCHNHKALLSGACQCPAECCLRSHAAPGA